MGFRLLGVLWKGAGEGDKIKHDACMCMDCVRERERWVVGSWREWGNGAGVIWSERLHVFQVGFC